MNGNSSRMSSNMIAIWPTGKWFNVPFGWRIIDCVSWSDRQLNFGYFDILSQEWARRTSGTTKAWRHCAWTRLIRPIWPLPFSSTNRKFRFDTFDLASAALPHPTRLPLVPLPARQGHQVDSRKHCERKNVSGRIRKSGQRREDVKLLIMFFPFFVSLFFRYPSNERNLPLDRFDGRIAVLATAEHFSMNVNQSTEIFTCNCTLWNKPKSNWLLHFLSNHLVILCIIFNSQIQFQIIVIVSISSHLNSTKKSRDFFSKKFF